MTDSGIFWPAFMIGAESGLLLAMAAIGITKLIVCIRSRVSTPGKQS